MLYVREDIPSKLLLIDNQPIEGFYIETNLRKKNGYFLVHIIQIETILVTILILLTET